MTKQKMLDFCFILFSGCVINIKMSLLGDTIQTYNQEIKEKESKQEILKTIAPEKTRREQKCKVLLLFIFDEK